VPGCMLRVDVHSIDAEHSVLTCATSAHQQESFARAQVAQNLALTATQPAEGKHQQDPTVAQRAEKIPSTSANRCAQVEGQPKHKRQPKQLHVYSCADLNGTSS
jgi:hypothetical protein